MFVRAKTIQGNGRTYRYLHIVENRREGKKVRQHIVGSLGRLEDLLASGDLERVIRQLVDQCPTVKIRRAEAEGGLEVVADKVWGPVLVADRLWEDLGMPDLLRELAGRKRFGFDFERMVFVQVLQRLLAPGSDLSGSKWIQTVEGEGFERLRLPHFYRCLGFLWDRKEAIEEHLYRRGLDLFSQEIDVVFFDTTSTYFEGKVWESWWAKRGKSRDGRPDHLQLVVAVAMRRDGVPIACEVWPGNTADVRTVVPMIETLKTRFRIRRVVFVCDRGMVSEANLEAIREARYEYIVGMKMRRIVEVRDEVLGRAGRYEEVGPNLHVKEVWVDARRRYVVCYNPDEAEKDRHDREAIVRKMEEKIRSGGLKSLIANRGYKRFLRVTKGAAAIDEKKVKAEERYDGKFVLLTTTDLPAAEVAEAYKDLTRIERLWREMKDVMEVRPIYHHLVKKNVLGHIFACFLALYLGALLRRKLADAGMKFPWDEIVRDLAEMRSVTVRLEDQIYRLRTPLRGCAGKVFQAVGAKVPPTTQPA